MINPLTDPNTIIIRLEIIMQLLKEGKFIDSFEKLLDFRDRLAKLRDEEEKK